MSQKIMRFLPIILVIAFIADIITMVFTDISVSTSISISTYVAIIFSSAIYAIIFYADYKKNNSLIAIGGILLTGIYLIFGIYYLMKSNNADLKTISSLSNIIKIYKTFNMLLLALKYYSFTNLADFNNNSAMTQTTKMGAIISSALYGLMGIIIVWNEKATIGGLTYNIYDLSEHAFQLMIFTFILYQFLDQKEGIIAANNTINNENGNTNIASSTAENTFAKSNKPKFRNPALEAQEARLKEQEMKNQIQQQQQNYSQMTQVNQIPMPTDSNQGLNQQGIENQMTSQIPTAPISANQGMQPMNNGLNNIQQNQASVAQNGYNGQVNQ